VADVIAGDIVHPRNLAADQKGSIHDDATASKLGFRGGTVAGSIHMDEFPPLLVRAFGDQWYRTGSLSLLFKFATRDQEPVRAFVEAPGTREQVRAWMETPAGGSGGQSERRRAEPPGQTTLVCEGTAGVGSPSEPSALFARDLRPCDPSELRILSSVKPGDRMDGGVAKIDGDGRAAPRQVVHLCYVTPVASLRGRIGDAVGLFGAIEIRHLRGPVLLGQPYTVEATVAAVGQSPKTEYIWFDSVATDDGGPAASMRMMLRFMKASSPAYAGT
jgi:hypothetical protein